MRPRRSAISCAASWGTAWSSTRPATRRTGALPTSRPRSSAWCRSRRSRFKELIEQLRAELDDLEKLQGQKLTWVPDNVVKQCVSCEAGFGLKTRRHHCRYCGRVFCAKCTKTTRAIPALGFTSPVRVCEPCDGILAQQ